jgi:small-conductance mechanosensitive channel
MPNLSTVDLNALAEWLRTTGLLLIGLVIAGWVALRLSRPVIRRLVARALDRRATESTAQELSAVELRKRVETIEAFLNGLARLAVVLLIIAVALAALGLLPALAGLSILGAALAIVLQNVIRDYLNGMFILLENQYSLGDVVKIAGVSGTVEEFSLRRTNLRDLDGTLHVVPNGQVIVASNMTRTWGRVNLDVTVAYGTDIDRVIDIVDEVGRALAADPVWRRRVLEPPRVDRVASLGDYGITLKILGNVRAADRWAAAGELRKRLLEVFRDNAIELPRPARVVFAGEQPTTSGAHLAAAGPTDEELGAETD